MCILPTFKSSLVSVSVRVPAEKEFCLDDSTDETNTGVIYRDVSRVKRQTRDDEAPSD